MPKFKSYNYDQTIMVPVNLQDQLVPGSLEFAIHYLVDNEIGLSGFEARFKNDEEGRPGYDPKDPVESDISRLFPRNRPFPKA